MRASVFVLAFGMGFSAHARVVDSLRFDASVPSEQLRSLRLDLGQLPRFDFAAPDAELTALLGLPAGTLLSADLLDVWLAERVRVVVGESIDASSASARWGSPKPEPSAGKSRAQVQMQNLGLDIYLRAKTRGQEASLPTRSLGTLPVRSPRAGIVRVGPGLFAPSLRALGANSSVEATGNSVARLLVLFHEARHSDGHDASLGFRHVSCPPGHWLEGRLACDRAPNGAYALESRLAFAFARSCPDCTLSDKEALRAQAIDALSRLLPKDAPVDPDEVLALDREIERLEKSGESPARLTELRTRRRALDDVVDVDWDTAPEGTP